MRATSLFACFIILNTCGLHGQDWHKIYFPSQSNVTRSVFESYDKGYALGGDFEASGIPSNGLIIKTDINGELLWYKTVSDANDYTSICDINATSDQGFILTGLTSEQSDNVNPFIMKLNACADLEWCRIYLTPNEYDEWGQSIWQIPGGYIALFKVYGEDFYNERIWLYRLDNEGELLWKQVYAQSDTAIYDEEGIRMCLTADYHIIINGICYYPDPGTTWPLVLRPFIIKTDSTGALDWELPWAVVNGENFYGESYNSITDNQGTIYSSSRHIIIDGPNHGDKPCMIKTDMDGNEFGYYELFPTSLMGTTHTINWLGDSTIALGYFWTDTNSYSGAVGVIKCDRFGNILKDHQMLTDQNLFSDAVTTLDNKLLLVGAFWDGIWRSHAFKLNADLDYDSIYSKEFVYDSLCPHPIPSDTIQLDCTVVGIEGPGNESSNLKMIVYPNPASDNLHILLPDQLTITSQAPHFQITTYYSKWNDLILEVYDLTGRCRYRSVVPFQQKLIDLRIADWANGLYLIRLVYQNKVVSSSKVLKRSD